MVKSWGRRIDIVLRAHGDLVEVREICSSTEAVLGRFGGIAGAQLEPVGGERGVECVEPNVCADVAQRRCPMSNVHGAWQQCSDVVSCPLRKLM